MVLPNVAVEDPNGLDGIGAADAPNAGELDVALEVAGCPNDVEPLEVEAEFPNVNEVEGIVNVGAVVVAVEDAVEAEPNAEEKGLEVDREFVGKAKVEVEAGWLKG